MAKKLRGSGKGPPLKAQKWLKEFQSGDHQGRTPTPEHFQSIWDTSYIPDRYAPATGAIIAEAEARLGIAIPASLKKQLLIQNGGPLLDNDHAPFDDDSIHWTNATVDGILPIESWKRATDDQWFDNSSDVKGLDLLIRIVAHSEAQLCLDYRKKGKSRVPGVTFVDVSLNPTRVIVLTTTVDEFILALIASQEVNDEP